MANKSRREGAKNFLKDSTYKGAKVGMKVAQKVLSGDVLGGVKEGFGHTKQILDDFKQMIFNHPEWYTHYDTSRLVNINLAYKQGVPYSDTSAVADLHTWNFNIPAFATVGIHLTVPQNDYDGWRTGVRLLWQQIRTANSGKVNFSAPDLEKYVLNVRLLHAVYATLTRLYRATYTFRSTNAQYPYGVIQSMGCNPDSLIMNAADLIMYIQRFKQRIYTTFPLNVDLFKRTSWLFSNVFADSDASKPTLYIPTLSRAKDQTGNQMMFKSTGFSASDTQFIWETTNVWGPTIAPSSPALYHPWTYDELIEYCEGVINPLISDKAMSYIAADIIKAFGNNAFTNSLMDIDNTSSLVILYDEYLLTQFQNAWIIDIEPHFAFTRRHLMFNDSNPGAFGTFNIAKLSSPTSEIEYSVTETSAGWADMTTSVGLETKLMIDPNLKNSAPDQLLDSINNYLLNWCADEISPGQLMSITRLIPFKASYQINNFSAEGSTLYYADSIVYTGFGTEIVEYIKVNVTGTVEDRSGTKESFQFPIPIAGLVMCSSTVMPGTLSLIPYLWNQFDWAARIKYITTTQYEFPGPVNVYIMGIISPMAIDWNTFAEVTGKELSTYYSYGNQSLLYAGPSQNQSNQKVYGKQNNSPMKSERKPSDPEITPPDKK